jgi:hypothetical protein
MRSQPTDWREVATSLTQDHGTIQYQKQMAHHLLPHMGRDWLRALTHAYLIREPAHVVASYAKVRGTPTLEDLGYPQQVELFRAYGGPVVDSADLLRDPAATLQDLCARLGIPYDPAMLTWPPGRRATDGVWAPHWYAAVERSTGFAPYDPKPAEVPDHLRGLVERAQPYYDELRGR